MMSNKERHVSAVDLVLLGIVIEQPCSAYEIQKIIEYRHLSKWVKISSPSVYKKVIQLEAKGYLASKTVQESRMPEKTVYTITSSGKEFFLFQMKSIATRTVNVFFDFNAVITNLNKVPKNQALKLIASIRAGMAESKTYIDEMIPQRKNVPLAGQTIMNQQILVLDTLFSWIDAFEADFDQL